MKVELISYTSEPEKLLSTIASICYKSEPNDKIIEKLLKMKHLSVLEHGYITFKISGISRTCSHQLVRHRIGVSITQQSQRYVDQKESNIVIPENIKEENKKIFLSLYEQCLNFYLKLTKDSIKKEDARFILPQATTTELYMTFNYRSLLHFYSERACSMSQLEIKKIADEMRILIKDIAPTIYKYMLPRCMIYKDISCKNKKCEFYKGEN